MRVWVCFCLNPFPFQEPRRREGGRKGEEVSVQRLASVSQKFLLSNLKKNDLHPSARTRLFR